MNAAQLHLALNHLPIGMVLIGTPLPVAAHLKRSKVSGEPAEEVTSSAPDLSVRRIYREDNMIKQMRKLLGVLILLSTSSTGLAAVNSVIAALNEAIQDEYKAQASYRKVISTFGEVRPFANIVQAETRHIQALSTLFERRGLQVPESQWNEENVPSYATVEEACSAAATAEIENIAMYDRLLELDLPSDVEQVFRALRAASLENHLPAFRRCA